MSNLNDELKAYKDELKDNEKTIQMLIKKNKHIKDHIKYLEWEIAQSKGDGNEQSGSSTKDTE